MLEIVQRLAEQGYQIEPEALELIKSYPGARDDLIKLIVGSIDSSVAVVRADQISSLICSCQVASQPYRSSKSSSPIKPYSSIQSISISSSISGLRQSPNASLMQAPMGMVGVQASSDITGKSTCVGEYEDFVRYFRDRYAKIREILSRRLNSRPIESLGKSTSGREVSLIGMVMDIRTTAKGHRVLELEDPTGMVIAIIQKDSELFGQSSYIIPDEVVGVTGVSDGGGRIFIKSLLWPDMPNQCQPLAKSSGGALLLSDLHVGSKFFMEDAWQNFVSWVNGQDDDPMGLSSQVKYIVIAGDLVDGIGIYPGQESDLAIMDIYEQYQMAAQQLNSIRKDISIVISPGNHDIVRQAEPQPALPGDIQKMFLGDNKLFVGSPTWITLDGISLLVYHGRSIDDLVLRIPGLSYSEPEKAMIEMLKRRHLSPIYGNRVSIAPEHEDHYVIQKAPMILHCGHVHTVGIAKYKGVTVINSGTWQSQTGFQKKMNIQPTPAQVPFVDLATMKVRRLLFA